MLINESRVKECNVPWLVVVAMLREDDNDEFAVVRLGARSIRLSDVRRLIRRSRTFRLFIRDQIQRVMIREYVYIESICYRERRWIPPDLDMIERQKDPGTHYYIHESLW